MKNYAPEYYKGSGSHPVQNYYSNLPSDSKQNAQIKRYINLYSESDLQKTFH